MVPAFVAGVFVGAILSQINIARIIIKQQPADERPLLWRVFWQAANPFARPSKSRNGKE